MVDLIQKKLPGKLASVFSFVSALIGSCVFTVLTIACWASFAKSWEIQELSHGLVRFPVYLFKFSIVFGLGLSVVVLGAELMRFLWRDAALNGEASS